MTGVDPQTHRLRGQGRGFELRQHLRLHGLTMGGCIGLGVKLYAVSTHFFGKYHGIWLGVHKQADSGTTSFGLCDEGSQGLGIFGKAPAVVGGELPMAVRHKSDLLRAKFFNQAHEVVQRIAFDIEFAVWPVLQQVSQVMHIAVADMPLVGSGMDCDALSAGLQAQARRTGNAGNTQMAGISQQRHFIQIDR